MTRGKAEGGHPLKRITAFVGSARRKHTCDAVVRLLDGVQSRSDTEIE